MIKTFRGLIPDDTQDTILLHTNDGSIGYRIVNFYVMSNNPTGADVEAVVSIWKISQAAASTTIDFSDNTLLATAFFSNAKAVPNTTTSVIIFDKEIVNQDIYVNVKCGGGGADSMNYYLELEQIKLDLSENTVATLKDIRNITQPALMP